MFGKLMEFIKKEPKKLTEEEQNELNKKLARSIHYEDDLFKYENDFACLSIESGVPILFDCRTGKTPSAWKGYDVALEKVQELKDKLSNVTEKEVSKLEVGIENQKPILN